MSSKDVEKTGYLEKKIDPSVTANNPPKCLNILSIQILKHLVEIKENVNEYVLMLEWRIPS